MATMTTNNDVEALTFTHEFFEHSRASLKSQVTDAEIIVVTANGLLQSSADSTFPFRQDGSFWYLTGVDEPDITLVMNKDSEYLIVPGRSASREAFDGAVDAAELTTVSGIQTILDQEEGWKKLAEQLKDAKNVATLAAASAYIEHYGFYSNPARATLITKIKDANDQIEVVDIRPILADMRVIKRPLELAAIQQAINITLAGITAVSQPEKLTKAKHEYEVEADLTREFRHAGSSGHAFPPIIAAGVRACTLHNMANNGPLNPGELMVMDVGADVHHYAADITRTVAVGTPTQRQRDGHAAVFDTQNFAMSLMKPGALLKENEQKIEDYLGKKLQDLGLITDINHENVREYFPHSTSHFLGLDVHDVGDYTKPLAPGMVITCEPGIYITEEAIGVRIEDDILITETGCVNLSQALQRELA